MKSYLVLIAVLLGTVLAMAPIGANATTLSIPGGKNISVVNNTPGTVFNTNATGINGTVSYNVVGSGGNDTFRFILGNASSTLLLTGLSSNSFNVTSGGGNSTFSFSTGPNSNFTIVEGNVNGSASLQTFAITGGANCVLNETSAGPVGNAIYSVDLGTNSTVNLSSAFVGNETAINLIF